MASRRRCGVPFDRGAACRDRCGPDHFRAANAARLDRVGVADRVVRRELRAGVRRVRQSVCHFNELHRLASGVFGSGAGSDGADWPRAGGDGRRSRLRDRGDAGKPDDAPAGRG